MCIALVNLNFRLFGYHEDLLVGNFPLENPLYIHSVQFHISWILAIVILT
uniref:Uncharacterized protein n=1 Tax=Arundo donax TaxID=35708 RepID=A0A0A9AV81_ARUDO